MLIYYFHNAFGFYFFFFVHICEARQTHPKHVGIKYVCVCVSAFVEGKRSDKKPQNAYLVNKLSYNQAWQIGSGKND